MEIEAYKAEDLFEWVTREGHDFTLLDVRNDEEFGRFKVEGPYLSKMINIPYVEFIEKEERGVLLYMRQEGRGIGLMNKIKAYALQDKGLDTVEANEVLGFKPDLRDYGIGAQILADLGLKKIKLMTNNPRKIVGLEGYGLNVVERIPLETEPTRLNRRYLRTKKDKLGHELTNKL